jgi:hypothetical protein
MIRTQYDNIIKNNYTSEYEKSCVIYLFIPINLIIKMAKSISPGWVICLIILLEIRYLLRKW